MWVSFQMIPVPQSDGLYHHPEMLEQFLRNIFLSLYSQVTNQIYLIVFLYLSLRHYFHFRSKGLLIEFCIYIFLNIASLMIPAQLVIKNPTKEEYIHYINLVVIANFIQIEVINSVQMIMSITLHERWIFRKSMLSISGSDTETEGGNRPEKLNSPDNLNY